MTLRWAPNDISDELTKRFGASPGSEMASDSGLISVTGSADIDVLITFDPQGISSHANHISLHYGALHWLRQVDPTGSSVALYSLTTTNIVRKYISVLDVPRSILSAASSNSGSGGIRDKYPSRLLFLSGASGYRKAQRAMTEGHMSQMLWFRWGWIGLSRYISVNDLKRQDFAPQSR
jgi:N-acetylglucosaminylphosphatidylinositol deacetylase